MDTLGWVLVIAAVAFVAWAIFKRMLRLGIIAGPGLVTWSAGLCRLIR